MFNFKSKALSVNNSIPKSFKSIDSSSFKGSSIVISNTFEFNSERLKSVTCVKLLSSHDASILSGIKVNLVKIFAFSFCGFAAGIAAAIQVSRISLGTSQAGLGMELQAIAAVILGGTSIYGGSGAVWRSIAGVMLLALINNGFNILNADPFYKDLTTGLVIIAAVALTSGRK